MTVLEDGEAVSITLDGPSTATPGTAYVAVLTILGEQYAVYLPLTLR